MLSKCQLPQAQSYGNGILCVLLLLLVESAKNGRDKITINIPRRQMRAHTLYPTYM